MTQYHCIFRLRFVLKAEHTNISSTEKHGREHHIISSELLREENVPEFSEKTLVSRRSLQNTWLSI